MDSGDKKHLAILLFIFMAFRLPFIQSSPLILDENLYAQMTLEFAGRPAFVTTYLGFETGWKPPLYFLLNVPFVMLGKAAGFGIELTYRLSGLAFSLAALAVLYYLVKNLYKNAQLAFVSSTIYAVLYPVVFVNNLGVTDNLFMLLELLSLYYYFRGRDRMDFAAGGALAFLAYFAKTVMAFAIPLLAVFFWYFKDRKILGDRTFLLSLCSTPVAAAIFAYALSQSSLLGSDASTFLQKFDLQEKPFATSMLRALGYFLMEGLPFTGFFLYGLWKKLPGFDPFLLVWLSLLPVLIWGSNTGMPWYLLPALPAVAVVGAVVFIDAKGKLDAIAAVALAICILISFVYAALAYATAYERAWERDAGVYLAGKGNVYFIGTYAPGAVFYKLETERAEGSLQIGKESFSNVCMGVLGKGNLRLYENREFVSEVLANKPEKFNFTRNFGDVFWETRPFLMECNEFKADYILASEVPKSIVEGFGYRLDREFGQRLVAYKREGTG
ncbi:hypothetical protein FJZ26_01055 [Candidatus Parvarchaeota archaeon]|nr:hypothetical protein [Candidatus Parvarchaeota archaeon]